MCFIIIMWYVLYYKYGYVSREGESTPRLQQTDARESLEAGGKN